MGRLRTRIQVVGEIKVNRLHAFGFQRIKGRHVAAFLQFMLTFPDKHFQFRVCFFELVGLGNKQQADSVTSDLTTASV